MKELITSLKIFLFLTLLLGVAYPILITFIGQAVFPDQATGQILIRSGSAIGSRLIAQKFEGNKYFWPRPSAVDYNPLSSGGSNWGATSGDLKKLVEERTTRIRAAHMETNEIPPDLVYASGSGLDPEISLASAQFQMNRVGKTRGMNLDLVEKLVQNATQNRQLGFLGEPRVNVLTLNLSLDESPGGFISK